MIGWWLCLAAAALSPAQSRAAKEKLDRIEAGKTAPGERVVLTEDEINSYLRYDYASEMPSGLSDPRIRLEPELVLGEVVVDWVEWQSARGEPPGALLALLLRGKRRVEVVGRWRSGAGKGQVDIESVRIGGARVPASLVTFLIENVVQPRYPEAVVGRPVELGYGLEEVRVERERVILVQGAHPAASQGKLP